jgi:hypothetical protein
MSANFRCGDRESLVAYLYDECDGATREAVAAHLVRCAACASEVSTLGATRARLMDWTPPPAALGFQVVNGSGGGPRFGGARFGRGDGQIEQARADASWWRRPLPAWAQAVAATVIFGAGLSVGWSRNAPPVDPVRSQPPVQSVVSRDDLTRLEQGLRAELAAMRSSAPRPAQTIDERALMKKIRALVAESEERQRRELALRTVQVMRDLDFQHRADVVQVQRRMGVLEGTIGAEVKQQRDGLNYLIRASQTR